MSMLESRHVFRSVLLACALGATAAGCRDRPMSSSAGPLQQAVERYSAGDIRGAEEALGEALAENPRDPVALLLAGDIALGSGNTDVAAQAYLQAVSAGLDPASCERIADGLSRQGAVFSAISVLQAAVAEHPRSGPLRHQLAVTLCAVGNEWDSVPHFQWLAANQQIELDGLVVLSDRTRPHSQLDVCKLALTSRPEDLRPLQGIARRSAYVREWEAVRQGLRPVVNRHPGYLPAQLTLGRALVELGDAHEVVAWSKQLPESATEHPDHWLSLGIWASSRSQRDGAARAYWEALRRDPNLSEALNRLATLLLESGGEDEAAECARRARLLMEVRQHVDTLIGWEGQSQRAAVSLAQKLLALDRPAEAAGWTRWAMSVRLDPVDQLDAVVADLQKSLAEANAAPAPDFAARIGKNVRNFPVPAWDGADRPTSAGERPSQDEPPRDSAPHPAFRLADEAASRGVDFQFDNGDDPAVPGMWLHQSNGGGVAATDFDGDGWPDLYLGDAGGEPLDDDGSRPNRLYRNLAGEFVDVTQHAAVGSRAFTQGVSAGDFNEDGFPDLLIANIGRNQLLRNNGDGTFTDVTDQAGLGDARWTTSMGIADLDGDRIPDVVELNYVAGKQPYEQPCTIREIGEVRACAPTAFDAEPDRVYRGLGDGSFEDVSSDWLAEHSPGRGLGLLVARFDRTPRLAVYVANDMSANHFWTPPQDHSAPFVMQESAGLRGLAFDAQSLAQASMGIAFGDPDSDGDFDLLVTNFHRESNAFYEQVRPGIWADRSRALGIVEPSLDQLGFGTQFLDLNADGELELIVTNGHVDDMRYQGAGFAMPTQVFRRHRGRWIEIPSQQLGEFFQQPHIGRSLITADLNRDGLADVVVSHLQEPVAVLVNQTPTTANRLIVDLCGVQNARDAIGAIVRVYTDTRTLTAQVTAGGGYHCSNERRLLFGLGGSEVVKRLDVEWVDGSTQQFEQLPVNQHLLVIEGRSQPVVMGNLRR